MYRQSAEIEWADQHWDSMIMNQVDITPSNLGATSDTVVTIRLFGPRLDVMLLGGASVIVFIILQALPLTDELLAGLATTMLLLAHVVNHPHFAHSYQIFYATWRRSNKAEIDSATRRRWWIVGVVAPILLAVASILAFLSAIGGRSDWLGAYLSLMGLLVGWHYVKQGFGMAMLDAALKRRFFSNAERTSLLINAYACWLCAWALICDLHSRTMWFGHTRLTIDIPDAFVAIACAAASVTTVHAGLSVFRATQRWRELGAAWSRIPVAGILAYVVTLYLWTVFSWVNPAYALVIPFFHSLQYLTVVWRYKRNELGVNGSLLKSRAGMRFLALGIALGAASFWLIPGAIEFTRTGQVPIHTPYAAPALACAWVFINVHHYFIDSVLWRQGNPDVSRHLFRHEPRA